MDLDQAIRFAAQAHNKQKDKSGNPYILHPLRIMLALGLDATESERVVAVCHDVVEDYGVRIMDLPGCGFSEEHIDAIDRLTKREGESWYDYISRVLDNPISKKVKQRDLEDNLDFKRLKNKRTLLEKDFERLKRYMEAYLRITRT